MLRVFAFGTLKKGFPLHEAGLGGAGYLGVYETVERFPLVVAGRWFAPMMLHQPGAGLHVKGELYEIAETLLPALDTMESVGKPGNLRLLVQVRSIADAQSCSAFAYLKAPELATPRHTGFLRDYQDRRFIPPGERV
jgi:gamma-glutamylaminecyclotransferase